MRTATVKNLYDRKFKTLGFEGEWKKVFGEPESSGAWMIWGKEKNGKTWFSLMLAAYLSRSKKVLYVSAEEGFGKAFVENCQRANIHSGNRNLQFLPYIPLSEIMLKMDKKRSCDIVFIDNVTIYNDELKNGLIRELLRNYPEKLFIFIAHEDRNEPYTASAKLIRKLAKVVMYISGLACSVSGRVPGGMLSIDSTLSRIFHGENFTKND